MMIMTDDDSWWMVMFQWWCKRWLMIDDVKDDWWLMMRINDAWWWSMVIDGDWWFLMVVMIEEVDAWRRWVARYWYGFRCANSWEVRGRRSPRISTFGIMGTASISNIHITAYNAEWLIMISSDERVIVSDEWHAMITNDGKWCE